ncbi:MAG: PilT/PilU family type 4a pilus ATPase [Candidatus Desantisbacteria bacterium]
MELDELLTIMVEKDASDLQIKVGRPPLYRIHGAMTPLVDYPSVTDEEAEGLAFSMMNQMQLEKFNSRRWTDVGYGLKQNRFRINIFHNRGAIAISVRKISLKIPTIAELGLPEALKEIVKFPTGLILVTGPTGSGKSTTLATLINEINETRACHIATVEDPVEYAFSDKKATISQREVGADVVSMDDALPSLLRQDPDVILVGEMRDRETVEFVLKAAEAGHLLLSTLHTSSAAATIDRILSYFPRDSHHQIQIELAMTLRATISQRLVKTADGKGRAAALEIMVGSPTIRKAIEKGEFSSIYKTISESVHFYKMQTLEQALVALIAYGVITVDDATANANNPDVLRALLHELGLKKKEGEKEEILISEE